MATPRVFISSTCYDLKHIRESLKYFVRTIGYEPVLSDNGDVFYNPSTHTHEACVKEVENCQILILIIGGRYGGEYKGTDRSITNHEYNRAVHRDIPIFALVEHSVHSEHLVFTKNKSNLGVVYPSVDNVKIFEFIDEVRKQLRNNAIYPFANFSDIEDYLRKQWAGMMYEFLLRRTDEETAKTTNKLLDDLSLAAKKSEELIKILLRSSDTKNPDRVISEIDIKIEAEKFPKYIINYFEIHGLKSSPKQLKTYLDNSENWVKFLLATKEFSVAEHQSKDTKEEFLLSRNSDIGINIGHLDQKGKRIDRLRPQIDASYNALRSVDDETKLKILRNFRMDEWRPHLSNSRIFDESYASDASHIDTES